MQQEKNILDFRRLFFEIREVCISFLFVNEKNQNTEVYEKVYCMCKFLFEAQMSAYNERKNTFLKSIRLSKKVDIREQCSHNDETSFINLAIKKGYAFCETSEMKGKVSYGDLLLEPDFDVNIWMNCDFFVNENVDYADDMKYCINLFREILDFLKKSNIPSLSFGIREILVKYYVLIHRYGAFIY